MAGKLTAIQKEFVGHLFGKCQGKLDEAAKATGLPDYTMIMDDKLIEEIKTRADQALALHVPRAVHVISTMLNNEGELFFNEKLHKVCTDILDRTGLSKVERNVNTGGQLGLVFLPNKQILSEPPKEALEHEKIQHSMDI